MVVRISEAEYDDALAAVEEILTKLGAELDIAVPNKLFERATLALGKRAGSIFSGFVRLVHENPTAAFVLIRPATEINLIARFIAARPGLHSEMWELEGERERIRWIEGVEREPKLTAKRDWPGVDEQWRADLVAEIERVRARAFVAGMKNISRKPRGRVMPNMRDIAIEHGDESTVEAYLFAYQPTSNFIHASGSTFVHGAFTDAGNRTVRFEEMTDPARNIRSYRALNAAVYASTLTVISEPLKLSYENVFQVAARSRDLLVNISTG